MLDILRKLESDKNTVYRQVLGLYSEYERNRIDYSILESAYKRLDRANRRIEKYCEWVKK